MDNEKVDYSKTVFSQGLVCKNTNNNTYCVVIDGRQGSEYDRCSLVLEFIGEDGFMINRPPNRALIPTGKHCYFNYLTDTLMEKLEYR